LVRPLEVSIGRMFYCRHRVFTIPPLLCTIKHSFVWMFCIQNILPLPKFCMARMFRNCPFSATSTLEAVLSFSFCLMKMNTERKMNADKRPTPKVQFNQLPRFFICFSSRNFDLLYCSIVLLKSQGNVMYHELRNT